MSDRQTYLPFMKMHGLGNDFIIVDARCGEPWADQKIDKELVTRLSHRRRAIGCDQFIVLRDDESNEADSFMEIWNSDGSRVGACGNATRCVGSILIEEFGKSPVTIRTDAGLLTAELVGGLIKVNMGQALLGWQDIPLNSNTDTAAVAVAADGLPDAVCVNMGNPHAVFFLDHTVTDQQMQALAPQVQSAATFPAGVNVSFAEVDGSTITLRVYERGAGITEACGSAACAATVAAAVRGYIDRTATVQLDGGTLDINWLEDGTVTMCGSATLSYEGELLL